RNPISSVEGIAMYSNYYVNRQAQSNGDHEVHRDDCRYLPSVLNRHHLGAFLNCGGAVAEARRLGFYRANGCRFCSIACHTS
ncbi:TPA: hypothetical protein ACXEYS_005082, partial [Escherichia coli]